MSTGYSAVQWNAHKRVYDSLAAGGIVGFIVLYVAVARLLWRGSHAISTEILLMRALAACAFALLTFILCIGPLARLDRRFLPLLYNRRHLGVMTFLVALAHAALAVGYYHGFGTVNALVSLLSMNTNYRSFRGFPFQMLGLAALAIMFLMAATSHDFWLRNLSARAWKRLHMLVYPAYALLTGHIGLGALQNDRGILAPLAVMAPLAVTVAVATVATLHLVAGARERRRDGGSPSVADSPGWIDVGPPEEIPENRARTICAKAGERIAVFRHKGTISAVTNVCAHQGGPLGEGAIIDGCITCPWHGWQYRPHDGCSPPPFTEKIATHQVRIVRGRVQVNPRPLAPGTPAIPAVIGEMVDG
jgi:methionine sulfoxide reductase heme-binding subunit